MDKDEQIKKLQEQVENLTKEVTDLKTSNTQLGEDIKERDATITDLRKNAKQQGLNFKKLRDMTEAEKELLSEKEKEILERQEKLENDIAEDKKNREERDKKDRESRIDILANRLAKGNKEVADQIKVNFSKLNPELTGKAITEEELTPFMTDAFKLTGIDNAPDPLNFAHNHDGYPANVDGKKDFSDSQEGKDLSNALGLNQGKVEENK